MAGFDVGSVYGGLKLETGEFRKSVAVINKGQKEMTKKADGASSAFKGLWKQMVMGLGVTTLITRGIRAIGRQFTDTIKQGREFGREWANVTTMLTISSEETEKLKKALIGISPTLGDTTELAKGMYQVLSASIEPAKAIEFLGEAAKAAKAGVTEVATAVDALTTVINAYGMSAEDVTDISDIMFQTVKRGKLTFGELAQSLGTVAPVAGTIGIKFEEVAAAIATLTRQGIPANKATMQMRQVLMAVLKPSEDAMKTANALGIEWSVAALKAKGLGGFLLDLKEKTEGDTKAMAALVPNVRALTGVMALAGRASEGFVKDLKLMADASGATEIAFQKQMESADFWIVTLKNAIGKFKISFFQGFIDPIKEGIGTSRELELKLDILSYKLQEVGKDVGKALSTLRSFFGVISAGITKGMIGMSEHFADNVTGIKKSLKELEVEGYLTATNFQKSLKNIEVPFEKIREELEKGKESFSEWSKKVKESDDAITKSKQPIVGYASALTALMKIHTENIAVLLKESKTADESRKKIDEYWKSIKNLSEDTGETIKKVSEETTKVIKAMTDEIKEAALDEFEYRKWAAQEIYKERKALLKKEGADKDAFVLLEKARAIAMKKIEKDITKKQKEEVDKRKKRYADFWKKVKEKYEDFKRYIASYTDIVNRYTMDEFDYKNLKIDEWYENELQTLKASLGNSKEYYKARVLLDKAYATKKGELAKDIRIKEEEEEEKAVIASQEAWEDKYGHVLNFANNAGSAYGDFAFDILSQGSDLNDALDLLWEGILNSFKAMIADMVQEWATNFIKKIIFKTSNELVPGVADSLGKIAPEASSAGAAAGSGFSAALAGAALFTLPLLMIPVARWLDKIFPKHVKTMAELAAIEAKKAFDEAAQEWLKKYGYEEEWEKGKITTGEEDEGWATGFEGVVTKPMRPLIGEVPEYVNIQPLSKMRTPDMIMPQARGKTEVNLTIRNDFFINNQVDPNFTQEYVEKSIMPEMMNKLETGVMKTRLKEILGVSG